MPIFKTLARPPASLILVLLRNEIDRAQVSPVAFKHPPHCKDPFPRGIIEHEILCQSQGSENTFVLDQTQRPKEMHRRVADADDTESDTFQQSFPLRRGKRASAYMND